MADDIYAFDDEPEAPPKDNLFLWTVFILLLIGIAFACWLGSFYIFGHPEQPRPYKILKKLGKLEAPKRFGVTAAPGGRFLNPQQLFDRYSPLSRLQLERENAELLRNFIKNYKETKALVPYATGQFEIISSYELQPTDLFPSGMVALAASIDMPQVLVEHVFPTPPDQVSAARTLLQTGYPLFMERTKDLSAVIHVERTNDGRMLFTVVPLLYDQRALKGGVGRFSMEPPNDLNVAAGLPITRGPALKDAMQAYAEYRRKKPLPARGEDEEAEPARGPELVRVDSVRPGAPVPETGALPEPPVATPIPLAGKAAPTPRPGAPATATPATQVAMLRNATPSPATTPMPVATPVPVATPLAAATPASRPPLKPFITSVQNPDMAMSTSTNWRTYAPGQQPAGRTITLNDAAALADRGEPGERLYLRGNFIVTASGEKSAILRPEGATSDPRQGGAGIRVIVAYPPSAAPPPEGTTFARDESRAFEVQYVRRGPDGVVNVNVREVTQQ
jgi:hypothetical protein